MQQRVAGGMQAQEEVWDLAPTGGNQCSGTKQPFTEDQAVYLTNAPDRIGPSPIKARYVEYTDDTFTTPRVRSALPCLVPCPSFPRSRLQSIAFLMMGNTTGFFRSAPGVRGHVTNESECHLSSDKDC